LIDSSDVENDKEAVTETLVSGAVPDRRKLFRTLAALAGLGITGTLLSQEKAGLLPAVKGYSDAYCNALAVDGSGLNDGTFSTPRLSFGSPPLGTGEGIASARTSGSPNHFGLDFYTDGTQRISITNKGNVGIGTTRPTSLLHVDDSSGGLDQIRIEQHAATGNASIRTENVSAQANVWGMSSGGLGFVGTTTSNDLKIQVNNTPAIYIPGSGSKAGNVGIGTTTPRTTLQVNGGVSVAVKTVTSAYTMTTSDFTILANATSAALTVTLPPASTTGMLVFIKKIDSSSHVVTISRAGTDTIEGATTQSLTAKNHSLTLIAGGSGVWYIQSSAT